MSLLSRIIATCRLTFEPRNRQAFQQNFAMLKELVSSLTYSELKLHPFLVSKKAFSDPQKAPCTFVNVYECDLFTLTIFILRPAYSMPIHDHPGITGILRMIHGSAKIQSYTKVGPPSEPVALQVGSRVEVTPEPPAVIDPSTGVAVLTPEEQNFHEITTVGDAPCAFFDVLSPPFGEAPDDPRGCSYFRRVGTGSSDKLYLEKIPPPYTYWCDSLYYELPEDCQQ